MDIFDQIASRIVKEQELIIGPLAREEAARVPGFSFVVENNSAVLTGNKLEIIDNLIVSFERLFGKASVEVCKNATTALLSELNDREIVERNSKDEPLDFNRLKHINETLYKKSVELVSHIKDTDAKKNDFLEMAAHHLRTPLSVVSGYLSLLQEGAYGEVREELKEVMQNIHENTDRLTALADTFLEVVRLENESIEYAKQKINVIPLIKKVVTGLKKQAQQKGLEIKIVGLEEAFAKADESKLQQILTNLLDNAIKYSDRGVVEVSVSAENEGCTVKIKDQGIGFELEESNKLFEKFYRSFGAKKVDANYGTGLGLYICKKYAEGMGGKIWAKSEGVGKGCEFVVWVPIKID